MTFRRAFVIAGVLFASLSAAAQPAKLVRLKDGQQIEVRGRLKIAFKGWRSSLILETGRSYLVIAPDEGTARVRSIELNSSDESLLAKHAGELVTAKGHMQNELLSPYYFNGAMLMADTVTLSDGTVVRHREPVEPPRLPATLTSYLYTVKQLPNHFDSEGEAVDLTTGKPMPAESQKGLGGCSLNGAADLMNCGCAEGFKAVRAGVVRQALASSHVKALPIVTEERPSKGMAQLAIPEFPTRPLILQIACERKPAGPKK